MKSLRRFMPPALALVFLAAMVHPASAQTGATTGAIIGAVTDNTKAVVPGVTVTVSGPSLMGARSDITGAEGRSHRIPALPPGEYTMLFELPGFATVTRQGVRISIGFTATINVEINPAGLAESVTVSGASPVVDLASSTVTTDFGADRLGNLVGSRDYAAVMAQLPAVSMNRPSVGGSGAVTYQRSTKYGMQGHDRGEVEGIISTQNMQGGTEAGYSDSDSFEDMAINVIGNAAEMPNPGTYTKIVSKSGSNVFHGRVYADYQTDALEGHNIDDAQIARGLTAPGTVGIRDLNRLKEFRDVSVDFGGYAVKDKLWFYGAYRKTYLAQNEVILIDGTHVLEFPVGTGKLDYTPKPNHKLTGYWFHGIKKQNVNILGDLSDSALVTMDALNSQRWPNGVYKGEYDAVLGSKAMFEIRYGNYYTRSITDPRTDAIRYEDRGLNRVYGATARGRGTNDRPQLNGSLTYFKDGWGGSHNFKVGGEVFHEYNKSNTQRVGQILLLLNNGAPSQVRLYEPAVDSFRGIWVWGGYAQDTWKVNQRLTVNLGLRLDQLRSYVPEQTGAAGRAFARVEAPVWTNPAPRIGVVYALTSDSKTVLKANYGQYWLFPLTNVSSQMNPNPSETFSLYTWTPTNPRLDARGFPIYEPGQQGRLVSVSGARPDGRSATTIDPNLENGFSRQALVYLERELAANFGVRTGFVWNGWRQVYGQVFANWPLDGFNVPVTIADPGRDGRVGTSDDGNAIQAFNLNAASLALPPDQVIQNFDNQDSDYYTWELTASRRQHGRWSLLASVSTTWSRQAVVPLQGAQFSDRGFQEYNANTIDVNTEDGRDRFMTWAAKASGTIDVGKGFRVSPMIQHQSGRPFARTFLATFNYNSAVYLRAEPVGSERMENLTLVNVRAEKSFRAARTTFGLFLDVYNLFNTNSIQEATTSSGSGFLRPSVITVPRIARLGVKFNF